MFDVTQLYTEKNAFKSYKEENLDLFPDFPSINFSQKILLDPQTGLLFDKKSNNATYISKSFVVNSNKNGIKSWIRSTPNFHLEEIKKKEIDERINSLQNYIKIISSKEIEILEPHFTYINLCFGTKYAYGHLVDLVLKLLYLPQKIANPCFLISDENGIKDIKEILKIVSDIDSAEFKLIKPSEKKLFFLENVIELKQVNGLCNFSNIKEYNLFLEKISKRFKNQTQEKDIFLIREPPLKRHILNALQLKECLKKNNITIIDGSETFLERAEILFNARAVCGYHGGLFLDTCFCKKNTRILEYAPVNRQIKCFLRMYKPSQNYYIKYLNTDKSFNVNLDIEEIMNFYIN